MLSSSRNIRRTPGLDRSYTMTDDERLARTVPWHAGVSDPIEWFLNCPGSEVCDVHFNWRDPEMCLITKAMIFGLLRRLHEKREELRLFELRNRRMRWICRWFLLGLLCGTLACSLF